LVRPNFDSHPVAIRFVFLGVESHVLQPLVEGHVAILNVRYQVIYQLVAAGPTQFSVIAVFVGS